jgi:hypothetical protein
MKVKIEFDTDINNSFVEFGMSETDIVAVVLKHVADVIQCDVVSQYNLIRDGYSKPIGMFSLEKP